MPNLNHSDVYNKVQLINQNVKHNLEKKGLMVPKKNKDGTISVGKFVIIKENGFYSIKDYSGEIVFRKINLPQTAAVIANDLAVRHFVDTKILDYDRKYGHAVFEESNQNKLLNKNSVNNEFKDVILCKIGISRSKKEYYRTAIDEGFKKLIRIR